MSEFYIKNAKTAQKVGKFVLRNDKNKNFIKCKWNNKIKKEVLTNNEGRVYLFAVNHKIYKIGRSSGKGGIKSTMSFYINSMSGAPGPNRFIMQLLIKDELEKKNKVEIYLIPVHKINAKVSGLLVESIKEVSVDSTYTESECLANYKDIIGRYPVWNFQENHEKLPPKYEILYAERRLKKTKM